MRHNARAGSSSSKPPGALFALGVFVFCFFASAAGLAAAPTQTPPGKRVRIGAYNVQSLFDVFDNPYTQDQLVGVKPRVKIKAVAAAIRAVNADVMAISEVENEGVLRAMVQQFLPHMGYRYVAVDQTNSPTGGSDGIISRLPIGRISSYRFRKLTEPNTRQTWYFVRDVMEVQLATGRAKSLDLFIVHFKSRRNSLGDPHSDHWRLAEALGARRIIDQRFAAHKGRSPWIVVLGDFNDTPGTKPVRVILGPDQPPFERLFDVHANLPANRRITYLRPPFRSTIDYIMVSRALDKRLVPGSATVLADKTLLGGSDHAPLAASFDLGK